MLLRTLSAACTLLFVTLAVRAQTPLLGHEIPVNTYTTSNQKVPAVAIDPSGNFVVVWQSLTQDGSGSAIEGQRFNAVGDPVGAEFQVNTYTTFAQYLPSVAADGSGNFVVVWTSVNQTGEDHAGIFGQRFDNAGNPVAGEFHVNTYTTNYQYGPSVAMDASGSFVVVWTSNGGQDGDGYGVFGQRYDASGVAQGSEFQVNTTTTGGQYSPAVAMSNAGSFVVVWSSGDGTTNYNIFGQRYDSSGTKLGGEFMVNAQTGMAAGHPAIAMDNDGDFAVAWRQYDADGNGIFGQRFDGAGVREGDVFQVNTYTTGDQVRPSIAFDADHEFIVSWHSFGQDDPAGAGVYAQRFGDPNVPVGSEFPVNVFTPGYQIQPAVAMNASGNFVVAWTSQNQDGNGYGLFARIGEFHAAQPMAVDAHGTGATSDLNGVLEPGETVSVEPAWQDPFPVPLALAGTASNLTGPAGGVYGIVDGTADYGTVNPGSTANCYDATQDCYSMTVGGTRPAAHWDATFDESLGGGSIKTWTLHVGDSFPDVPRSLLFYKFIENLFHNGVTGGCGGGNYCPGNSVTRAQMAVFLLKSEHGSRYLPPPCAGVFGDVACPSQFADWIERLYAEGITGGCGGNDYCPDNPVTRQQMAVFLLKAKNGSSYVPNACSGIFGDVACPSLFADWIEDLYNQQITGGCQVSPLLYCPTNANTRGQMAVFLVKTFGLLLYGP
jgi:hypothetical protein